MSMTLAARSHHVHHVSGPARRAQPAGAAFAPLLWFRRKLRARPGTTLAHCAFAIAAGLILFNALAFQREANTRSFINVSAAQPARPDAPAAVAALPAPPVRPAELQAPQRPQPSATPSAAPSAAPLAGRPVADASREVAARDPIGDLIRSGQIGAGAGAQAGGAAAPEARPVLAAQRALNRVGAGPVKADGVFGEETRAAIERFERERRIPVTRELSPRTLRELTAASGIRME
jgi:hypothetical protein